jgi:GNAT superfamily N-acetyltransferase
LSISFNIAHQGFSVRAAEPSDAQAVRMLLPAMASDCDRFVALDGERHLVIGAAAATRVPRMSPAIGPGVAIHVIPPCRRCGVGGALLEQFEAHAKQRGANALYAAQRVEVDSEEMRGWRWLGFDVCETVEEHELPVANFDPVLGPMLERMRRHGRIPADAMMVPLYATDAEAVVRLHLENLGGDAGDLLKRIRGHAPNSFHPDFSRVIVVGNRVVAAVLARRVSQPVIQVDAIIVAPEARSGWANLWLKLEATRRVIPHGVTHLHFTTFDRYTDTRRLVQKLGGRTVRTTALMWRQLE